MGVYVHGSLAMGCYYRPKSDFDLLVVVDSALPHHTRRALAVHLLDTVDRRPVTGGLELSVVHAEQVAQFEHPLPYEFHFSEKWADDVGQGGAGPRGTDSDLAAHCTVVREFGIAVRGRPPEAVFGPVPHDAFIDSIVDDFRWIVDEAGIHESPIYGVLNLCRVLQVLAEGAGTVPSKEQGAVWALAHLPPEHHGIIREALECYRDTTEVPWEQRRTHGHAWNGEALTAVSAYAQEVHRVSRP